MPAEFQYNQGGAKKYRVIPPTNNGAPEHFCRDAQLEGWVGLLLLHTARIADLDLYVLRCKHRSILHNDATAETVNLSWGLLMNDCGTAHPLLRLSLTRSRDFQLIPTFSRITRQTDRVIRHMVYFFVAF